MIYKRILLGILFSPMLIPIFVLLGFIFCFVKLTDIVEYVVTGEVEKPQLGDW